MAKRKPKAGELTYHGTENEGRNKERKIVASHEGRVVGYLASEMGEARKSGEQARGLKLAWVDPEYQRRGVASTMLGLERHRTGYTPVGDEVLSKKGAAFQRGTGVPTNPKGEHVALPAFGEGLSASVQEKQGHVMSSPQFDPALVRRTAPYKAPRTKPGPQPEQGQLFDPSTLSTKGISSAAKNLEATRALDPAHQERVTQSRTQRRANGTIMPRPR